MYYRGIAGGITIVLHRFYKGISGRITNVSQRYYRGIILGITEVSLQVLLEVLQRLRLILM